MALDTISIHNYLSKYQNFKGVYAIDSLPYEMMSKPFGIVINLDPKWKPGSHWVAVYVPKYGPSKYFDSFGMKPPDLLLSFLERNSKGNGFNYNKSIYQDDLSIKCGYFAILFLEACFLGKKFPLVKCMTNLNEILINNFY